LGLPKINNKKEIKIYIFFMRAVNLCARLKAITCPKKKKKNDFSYKNEIEFRQHQLGRMAVANNFFGGNY
jgi:hypothetical protein